MTSAVAASLAPICARYGVDLSVVLGRCRSRSVHAARRACAAHLRTVYGWSTPEIGRALGRDHSSVWQMLKGAV